MIIEDYFVVRTVREGSVKVDATIEKIVTNMGCTSMNNRALGTVAAIVEQTGGTITKSKLNWGTENDPDFNISQKADASALLMACENLIKGYGGGDNDIKVKIIAKK